MQFFNSNIFVGAATLVTGGVAIYVYFSQKRDRKKRVAIVLLTEIRFAEEKIEKIRNQIAKGTNSDLPSVFPSNNWKEYSYLFVDDFDQDEFKLINSFYDYGELVEAFIKRYNEFFWVTTEERARVTVQKNAEIITQAIKLNYSPEDKDGYIESNREFLSNKMDKYNLPYIPQKPAEEIISNLNKIEKITTSSCGIKLKKIAKLY